MIFGRKIFYKAVLAITYSSLSSRFIYPSSFFKKKDNRVPLDRSQAVPTPLESIASIQGQLSSAGKISEQIAQIKKVLAIIEAK
jgi:hypothetical protein